MAQPRFGLFPYLLRKRIIVFLLLSASGFRVFRILLDNYCLQFRMEHRLAEMQLRIENLTAIYQAREEEVIRMQSALLTNVSSLGDSLTNLSPDVQIMLKNMRGTKAAEGVENLQLIRTPLVHHPLPFINNNPFSWRPAFHMRARRHFADYVIGIPTVKRDKETYLLVTLSHLIKGVKEADINNTLIIVFIGETDLKYVLKTAHEIETIFPKYVAMGLIEVLSPPACFYPNFERLLPTLEDSEKRFRWRTKQNLDALYLMAYAQTRGIYYLMLEDDVIAKEGYMQDIKEFTAATTISNPQWFVITYSDVGGIAKLFRSVDLLHFVTYLHVFYNNMPIDWLLESYLSDRICGVYNSMSECTKKELLIKPHYKKRTLFVHIGLFSSLKGKIQKDVQTIRKKFPRFYKHRNPPVTFYSDIRAIYNRRPLRTAYYGTSFFRGTEPKRGDIMSFSFKKPTTLESFKFQSGNVEHDMEIFYNTVVEILPMNGNGTHINVGRFDEFGLAEGKLGLQYGPLREIRLRVLKNQSLTNYCVVLSEIELKVLEIKTR